MSQVSGGSDREKRRKDRSMSDTYVAPSLLFFKVYTCIPRKY